MNEAQKEVIRKEARQILDKFAKALEKVPAVKEKEIAEGTGMRKEGEGQKADEDFRKRFFENAPKTSGDCVVAERASWT